MPKLNLGFGNIGVQFGQGHGLHLALGFSGFKMFQPILNCVCVHNIVGSRVGYCASFKCNRRGAGDK